MNLELCVAGLLAQVHWDVMTSFCKLISGSAMTHLADVVSEFTVTTPVLYLVSVVGSLSSELDSISLSLSLSPLLSWNFPYLTTIWSFSS